MEATKKKSKGGKGRYCVAGAPNDTSCMNHSYTPGVSMHLFPRNEQQRRQWVSFVRRHRAGFTPSATSALCSIHFKPTDFAKRLDIDLGDSSGNVKHLRRLEIGAVPTIDAAGTIPRQIETERDRRRKRKVCKLRPKVFMTVVSMSIFLLLSNAQAEVFSPSI